MPRARLFAISAFAIACLVVTAGCSRHDALEEDAASSATSSEPQGTTVPPSSDPSTTESTLDPAASSTTTTGAETDVFGHTEAETASFVAAYSQAFRAECERIFASVGGGPLADPDFPEDQYVVGDCLFELDETWGELVDSVEEARMSGIDDAQIAASDLADPLCNLGGTICWSYGD
jgi:hypothetical protein